MKNIALIVGSGAARQELTATLQALEMEILAVNDWRGARQTLDARPEIAVAITALTLGDGNWCDVVQHAARRNFQTAVVVISRTGSARLWAELLWRGAHDLLVEPLSGFEVRQTIEGAVRAAESARRWAGAPCRPIAALGQVAVPEPAQTLP